MYKFNIERYFIEETDIAIIINASQKMRLRTNSGLEVSHAFNKKNKNRFFRKYRSAQIDHETIIKINACKDFKLIRDFECALDEVLAVIRWSQTELVGLKFLDLSKRFSSRVKGTFLEIMLHLMAVLVYGIYRIEDNNKVNFEVFCDSLDRISDFVEFFYEDHKTIFYAFQAMRLARLRKDAAAIEVVEKINIECEPAFRAYLFQQLAIVYQLICDYDLCLFYTIEAMKLFEGSSSLDRDWFMKNIAVWCYLKLEDYTAARKIVNTFLTIARVSDHERYRLMSCVNLGYLYYFEFRYDEAYNQFKKVNEKNKYETKALLFLLSLKLKGHGEYAEELGSAYLLGNCWAGYYMAALYFQALYDQASDYYATTQLYQRVMEIFDENRFTILHDVILNEHKMYENYCRINQFLLLQRNFEKLKGTECNPLTVR